MGSGGIFHKFWCDKCQCYVDFSDFETCESICGYCEARENKARAEAAEAEVARLRAEAAEQLSDRAATFVQECGYLVGIEVYSPDDIPVIAERLGALHTRAEAAEARGAAAERAAIAAWLRLQGGRSAWTLVEEIEKCAHLWGVNRAG